MSVTSLVSDGDIAINESGHPIFLEGKDKLIQDLTHVILCPKGQNIFHPNYGSTIHLKVGLPMTPKMTPMNIRKSVVDAFSYYANIQTIQGRYQKVISVEKLLQLGSNKIWKTSMSQDYQSLEAIEVIVEPTIVTIRVRIITAAYEEVIIPFFVYMVPTVQAVSGYSSFAYIRYNSGARYDQGNVYR